jgi:hypothetical protein
VIRTRNPYDPTIQDIRSELASESSDHCVFRRLDCSIIWPNQQKYGYCIFVGLSSKVCPTIRQIGTVADLHRTPLYQHADTSGEALTWETLILATALSRLILTPPNAEGGHDSGLPGASRTPEYTFRPMP